MSSTKFELIAYTREVHGKLACKKLRIIQNQIPAVIYGGHEANSLIALDHNQILQASFHENFYSQILHLNINNTVQKVLLKDLQRHPFKPKILHLDFQRIKETDIVHMQVPLHFIGIDKCPGVKSGGLINHHANTVEVRCEARHLPEFIEVDLSELNLGQSIHLSNLKLPEFVKIFALYQGKLDAPVVSVQIKKEVAETQETAITGSTAADKEVKEKDNKDKAKASATSTAGSNPKAAIGAKSDKK